MSGTLTLEMKRIDPTSCMCPDCAGHLLLEDWYVDDIDITGWIQWRCTKCGRGFWGRFDAEITGMNMYYDDDIEGDPILDFEKERSPSRKPATRRTATRRKAPARRTTARKPAANRRTTKGARR